MKTKKTKKGLALGLSAVLVGTSLLVASGTASASSESSSCTGPKTEHSQGGTFCKCAGEGSCRDNSGCDGGGGGGLGTIIDIIKIIFK